MNPSSFLYFQSYTVGLSIPLRIKKIAGWITLGSTPPVLAIGNIRPVALYGVSLS